MTQDTMQMTETVVGIWRLASLAIQKDDGNTIYPFGEDAQGALIYTDSGFMSVQITGNGRPHFASGDQQRGSTEEMAASLKGCISYYGTYHLDHDDGCVVHEIEHSLFPNWEGTSQKRFFDFSENRLRLSTPPTLWDGSYAIGIVEWQMV